MVRPVFSEEHDSFLGATLLWSPVSMNRDPLNTPNTGEDKPRPYQDARPATAPPPVGATLVVARGHEPKPLNTETRPLRSRAPFLSLPPPEESRNRRFLGGG